MFAAGTTLFDPAQPEDAGLALMDDPDHPAVCLITRKILYTTGVLTGAPTRPPIVMHAALSGLTSWTVPVRIRIGIAGQVQWANEPMYAPDDTGFQVAISLDAGFQVDSFQVDWLALWD